LFQMKKFKYKVVDRIKLYNFDIKLIFIALLQKLTVGAALELL